MVTTNAHIGNYGVRDEEAESGRVQIAGLICKNFSHEFSRPGATSGLYEYLRDNELVAISDVDTRALVAHIRENGAMNAVISSRTEDMEGLRKALEAVPSMAGLALASEVTTDKAYTYGSEDAELRIAALDLGIKNNILRSLEKRGACIRVFPYGTSLSEMEEWGPDAYFISNGPGDPEPLDEAVNTTREMLESGKPLFGICLGHQVLALSQGVSTYKMHNGHRGINHPILNLMTGKGEITTQNHGFAVSAEEVASSANVEVTHTHLNDQTVAGIRLKDRPAFSVQYHPEASPGPNDSMYLFDQFISEIEKHKHSQTS
jgi:carbamoyl-phosphate synthase small subunit